VEDSKDMIDKGENVVDSKSRLQDIKERCAQMLEARGKLKADRLRYPYFNMAQESEDVIKAFHDRAEEDIVWLLTYIDNDQWTIRELRAKVEWFEDNRKQEHS